LAEQGHWPQVADGPALKPGAQDARVPAMRELLRLSGDLPRGVAVRGGQERLYDAPLQEAMRRFQRRHGLTQDAVAGAQTLAALRITPAQRVQQMALALEQMRRSEQPENGIVVNVPQYRLQAFENGREVLAMDVIVGRSDRATPMFDKVIDRLVINPTWTPTRKIINEDLLPKLRDNPSYAYNGGYKVYDRSSGSEVDATRVDWQQVNADDVRLVQKPGRSNALGRIKFMLPDNQAIYLHDTASPRLFSKSERALSSGCIRLSDPEALLDYVLKGQSDTQIERANRAWQKAGDEPELVMLNHSVPVRMAYFSARVNREGEVMFFDDVYGRDAALRKSMQGRLAASPAPR
jgi:murein L,D-transpeptidase YcbB/YkuD